MKWVEIKMKHIYALLTVLLMSAMLLARCTATESLSLRPAPTPD